MGIHDIYNGETKKVFFFTIGPYNKMKPILDVFYDAIKDIFKNFEIYS